MLPIHPFKELWLIRHGQTTSNRDGALAGWVDVELTSEGEAQARALRTELQAQDFDSVWASDLQRALRTATLAWGPPQVDPRLREIDFGALDGQSWHGLQGEHKEALMRFEGFVAPGGESLEQLEARVHAFIEDLPEGRHLLFTHGGVIRLLCHRLGHTAFPQPGTVTIVDWVGRTLLRANT